MSYLLEHLNHALNSDYTKEDIDKWEYHDALELDKNSFWTFYHGIMKRATSYHIQPQPGALKAIPELAKNNDLYILTARQHSFRPQIVDWVNHWFPDQFKDVYTCGGQESGLKKIWYMDNQDLDMLIDDNPSDYYSCWSHGRSAILYTAEHNKDLGVRFRADDWEGVEELVRSCE